MADVMTQGRMTVLGSEGDLEIKWNPQNFWEVDIARRAYDDMQKVGFAAFEEMNGHWVRSYGGFDENVGWYTFLRASAGG